MDLWLEERALELQLDCFGFFGCCFLFLFSDQRIFDLKLLEA